MTLRSELYPFLTKSQIKALPARHDCTMKSFDRKIAVLGEDAVLFDLHELRPSTNPIRQLFSPKKPAPLRLHPLH